MVPGGRPLMDIGSKYNTWKVIYFIEVLVFIVTDNAGSTQEGITYLSKYTETFTNVTILPVACLLVMSIFVSAVNEVESTNK